MWDSFHYLWERKWRVFCLKDIWVCTHIVNKLKSNFQEGQSMLRSFHVCSTILWMVSESAAGTCSMMAADWTHYSGSVLEVELVIQLVADEKRMLSQLSLPPTSHCAGCTEINPKCPTDHHRRSLLPVVIKL